MKKTNILKTILYTIVIIALIVEFTIILPKYNVKKSVTIHNLPIEETEKIYIKPYPEEGSLVKEDTSDFNYEYNIYYDNYTGDFCYQNEEENCNKKYITIKTQSKTIDILYLHNDLYVFYIDNDMLRMYNDKTKEIYTINIPSNYYDYIFEIDEEADDEFYGVTYLESEEEKYSFFSIYANEVLYDKEYYLITSLSKDYLTASYYKCNKILDEDVIDEYGEPYSYDECFQEYEVLLSTKEKKEYKKYILENKNNYSTGNFDYNFKIFSNSNTTYFAVLLFDGIDDYYSAVFNEDLSKELNGRFYKISLSKNGLIYLYDNKKVISYNSKLEKVKENNKYNVEMLIDKYIVAIKNNKLVLSTIDNKEIQLANWNEKNILIYDELSGYNDKEGVYLVVEDNTVDINKVWKSCQKYGCDATSKKQLKYANLGYKYYYNPSTGKKRRIATLIEMY